MRKILMIIVLLLVFVGCAKKPTEGYRVIKNDSNKTEIDQEKIIDITEFIEGDAEAKIPEAEIDDWAVAVHSYKTGYTYYYNDSGILLGKRSEFKGNPREELIQEKFNRR